MRLPRSKLLSSVTEAVGQTPLVRLDRAAREAPSVEVYAKLEFANPGGSVKDRAALRMMTRALDDGRLTSDKILIDSTSGNTGVGVALVGAVRGYRCIFTMPDKMSKEKQDTLKAFGAKVVVTPTNVPADSPDSYYSTAKRLHGETPGSFYLNQYHNRDNVEAHYRSTGPELWRQLDGRLDAFVAGIGTGGTMSGAGRYLKEQKPTVRNVGVDPVGSIYHAMFHTGQPSEPHVYKVEGIGEDMVCGAMDMAVMDDVRQVDDKQCFAMARRLAREEGILAGGSSGAAVHVAVEVAKEMGPGKTVVVVLPDGGRAYISKFFSDEWMRDNGFLEAGPAVVRELLGTRKGRVITARADEPVQVAARRLREFDVSQLPVVDATGKCVGMLHESDVLHFLLDPRRKPSEPVANAMASVEGAVTLDTPVEGLRAVFDADKVAVVLERGAVVGIVSKIDVIDFLTRDGAARRPS
jgi:cystathionine beta-synthase